LVGGSPGSVLGQLSAPERVFFIDNLLVRIHFIIVMIRWTGLAPWEFEFAERPTSPRSSDEYEAYWPYHQALRNTSDFI